jgi:uncharacterized protein YjiK
MKRLFSVVLGIALVITLLVAPAARAASATVIRMTHTSNWKTPSPDPMGLTYDAKTHRLLVSDSEVNEGSVWKGRNLFVARLKGNLTSARTLRKFTLEPEDLALNNRHRALYVVDDNLDRVFVDHPGRDGLFGTRDDVVKVLLKTRRFGSHDPEGLAWVPAKKMLIVTDSGRSRTNAPRRVYKIRKGRDGRFGTRDDLVQSFSVRRYGFTTIEDVVMTPFTHHLMMVSSRQRFILEATLKGKLIRKIDLTGTGIKAASGITFAPGTDGSKRRLYVTDSGVDNSKDPSENDGRLFELKIT